ncbi:HDOD domain-containing protein [Aromatoleum evansii]|uniref:HDOD domain-containing protein n=1 Tax=Aromatoleum evansii TaxID=59406 RepID=A0ABZ1AIV5_AROEV|nr:HDOD domain-containing protein [Aromatoleum evansii]
MLGWLKRLFGSEPARPAFSPAIPPSPREPQPPPPAVPPEPPPPAAVHGVPPAIDEELRSADASLSLLCRSEVLDREQNLTGYAFELREDVAGRVRATGRRARDFMDGLLVEQIDRYGHGAALKARRLCLRVWEGFLAHPALARLQGLDATLLVRPELPVRAASAETLACAARLREAGVHIVIDHGEPGPWLDSVLPQADAALFRMGFCLPEDLGLYIRAVRQRRADLPVWAWEVGTPDEFELAARLGCAAFSGGFVTRREDWKGNSLSPHGMRLASLLQRLRSGVDTQEIAVILKHDLALAYRLLRYVNAAAWGLNHHISSVEQAILVLGQQPLQRWVSMMLLGSARSAPGAAVVMEDALVRGRMLELLGGLRGERDPAAQLFVLGLFSLLDVALKVPLEDAIRPLKLPDAMQDALLHQRGPMAPYLELVLAFERGDAQRVTSFADVLGIDVGELNRLQFEALDWVHSAEA